MTWVRSTRSTDILITPTDPLFQGLGDVQLVWMSHGDSVSSHPGSFKSIAWVFEKVDTMVAMKCKGTPWWGVQFHPEMCVFVYIA